MQEDQPLPPSKPRTPPLEPSVQQQIDQALTAAKGPNPGAFFNNFLMKLPILDNGKITLRPMYIEDVDVDATYRATYGEPSDATDSDDGGADNEFPKNYSPAFLDSTPKQFLQSMVQAIEDAGMTVEELGIMRTEAEHEYTHRTTSSDYSRAERDYFERIALIYAELVKKGFNRKDLYT